jgi:hypothetical protein
MYSPAQLYSLRVKVCCTFLFHAGSEKKNILLLLYSFPFGKRQKIADFSMKGWQAMEYLRSYGSGSLKVALVAFLSAKTAESAFPYLRYFNYEVLL